MSDTQQHQIEEVSSLCSRILDGELDLIEGCRLINNLRWDLDSDGFDDRFDYFVGFEMKCYAIPPKESRERWSKEALKRYDALAGELKCENEKEFLEQCRVLKKSYEDAT